jgi:hypothetical protein
MASHQEEELEAAIWDAMARFKVTAPDACMFIDSVIIAARKYAAGDSASLTAMRREVLASAADTSADDQPTQSTGASIPRRSQAVTGK